MALQAQPRDPGWLRKAWHRLPVLLAVESDSREALAVESDSREVLAVESDSRGALAVESDSRDSSCLALASSQPSDPGRLRMAFVQLQPQDLGRLQKA